MSGESLLFVYGTLRRGYDSPMAKWLAARATYLGRARLPGRLYDLGRYPAFVSVPGDTSLVYGDLYQLPERGAVLRKLDRFEGIGPGQERPWEYRRERLTVILDEGGCRDAWVYVYARPVARRRRIASGDFLNRQARR